MDNGIVPTPAYILRGHSTPIHSLLFWRHNTRLVSGDASGFIVVWDLALRRPAAVWRAHASVVLGIGAWDDERLISHGRDGRVIVWKLEMGDEKGMDCVLPVEDEGVERRMPWVLHLFTTSELTFCSFALCKMPEREVMSDEVKDAALIAAPGEVDSSIVLYGLPLQRQVGMIPAPEAETGKTGMVMSLKVLCVKACIVVVAGYESGRYCVFRQDTNGKQWEIISSARPHEEPILSLDVVPATDSIFTSGADSRIAKYRLESQQQAAQPVKVSDTHHAGQQGLHARSDGKIFATAGWDSAARVYSCKTLKELAELRWHKDGCYSVAFAELEPAEQNSTNDDRRVSRTVAQTRELKAQTTHWLAVGAKDGKISLWDIY